MTLELYIQLIVYTVVACVLVYVVQIPLRKIRNVFIKGLLFVVKVVLTLLLGLALIAYSPKIVWKHEYVFAALYLALIPDVFTDIISFIAHILKKKINNIRPIIFGLLAVVFAVYNIINMQTIRPDFHTISSPKLKHEYRLAFFADLHYGSSQSQKTVDDALDDLASQNPDYLLLVGDITDENTTKEEMEYIYKKIGSLNIPTYFIYGNHDRQESGLEILGVQRYTEAELEKVIKDNGITILYEDFVKINDDLIFLGREDPSHPDKRKAVKDLPFMPRESYIVSLDHTPYQNDEIIELKADLQLSGHTHAAQFFPIQTIYKLAGFNTCGEYHVGDTTLYITPGIAGWAVPLRSEAHSRYEIFDLIPE